MICRIKNRFFLYKTDFFASLRENKKQFLTSIFWLFAGIALGVYIGIRVGEKEPPFGMFAKLFHLHFTPFSYIGPDFLRFLLFELLVTLAFFLPYPALYPAIALIFFGKYFGQLGCIVFLTDSFLSALLSALLLYIPLLLIGGWLIFRLSLHVSTFRLCNGTDRCKGTLKRVAFCLLKVILPYFFCLFFLYVIMCGLIYLIVIAL